VPQPRRIVVIGGSAGAIEGLRRIASALPDDLPAAVFAAVHVSSTGGSALPELLGRISRLRVFRAASEMPIEAGHFYVGPPDRHLLVGRRLVHLSQGPKENGHRPAVDALFRSAARNHGRRVIGVVLSGMLDDGALGLAVIREEGGIGVVEDPNTAAFADMPQNAIQLAKPEHVVPVDEMAEMIARLCWENVPAGPDMVEIQDTSEMREEEEEGVEEGLAAADVPGVPTGLTCPECHGALWEDPPGAVFFRCRIGHRLSAESLLEAQAHSVENALWAALRALEEKASMAQRIGERLGRLGDVTRKERYLDRADSARRQAQVLRQALAEPPD
jgi:two-component system chemotaxis response regulator CheB